MLERGFSLNNQLLTRVRIRSAITEIGMHVVQWAKLTTLLVLSLSAPFFFFFENPDLGGIGKIPGS